MYSLLLIVLFGSLLVVNAKINTTNIPEISYLFSSFDADEKAGLRLSYSTDGYIFEGLNDYKPVLTPKIGDKILRDPCIIYGPDNVFHLVYTTSWNSKEIGYAYSKDLVNWSEEVLVPVMHNETGTEHSWAPEVVYDSEKKHYLIFWSSPVKGKLEGQNHIWSTTTTDFKTYTPSQVFYTHTGDNNIDATLLHDTDNNEWIMFIKDETAKHIDMVKSKTLDGPWGSLTRNIAPIDTKNHTMVEGPTSMKIGKYYHVYFDIYQQNHMGLIRSTDLIHWEDMTAQIKFPPKTKHGTIFQATPDMIKIISKAGL